MNVGRGGIRLAVAAAGMAGVAVILALAVAGGSWWPAGGPARAASGQCGTFGTLEVWDPAIVTLTPDSGPPGSSLEVGLTGFAENPGEDQPVEILWDWNPVTKEGALIGGGTIPLGEPSVTVGATLPGDAAPASYPVTACWLRPSSERWFYRSAPFEVTEPPSPTPSPTPTPTPTPTATPEATSTPSPTETPEPTTGQVFNCPQPNKWAIAVWNDPNCIDSSAITVCLDGTDTGEALAACGEGVVDAAYYIDPDSQQWLRYLVGRPELSNLEALGDMQGVIVHGKEEPQPPPPSPAPSGEGEMRNCPQSGKWAIAVWDGADIDTAGALSNCAEEIDFAYELDPDSQQWGRWFAGLPEISNFEMVKGGQGLIAHGKATLPTPAPLGRIAFVSNRDANDLEIYAVNSDGTGLANLTKSPGADDSPVWSPDGSKLAFRSYRDGNWEIYVMNADGSGQTRLTTDPAKDEQPVWSPDGSKIAFVSWRSGGSEIWVMNANGTGQTKLTWWPSGGPEDPAWSPDGSKIAFGSWDDVYVMNSDGTGITNLTNVGPSLWALEPVWSPDGSKIAYRCCDDADWEIYVMNADGTGKTNLTNSPGWDSGHAWSPDGTQIAFNSSRDGDDDIYVMKADGTSPTQLTNIGGEHNPSWSPDSSRLVVECTLSMNAEVCVVDANSVTNVSNHPWVDTSPVWSP